MHALPAFPRHNALEPESLVGPILAILKTRIRDGPSGLEFDLKGLRIGGILRAFLEPVCDEDQC